MWEVGASSLAEVCWALMARFDCQRLVVESSLNGNDSILGNWSTLGSISSWRIFIVSSGRVCGRPRIYTIAVISTRGLIGSTIRHGSRHSIWQVMISERVSFHKEGDVSARIRVCFGWAWSTYGDLRIDVYICRKIGHRYHSIKLYTKIISC